MYLHGYSSVEERAVLERERLDQSVAMDLAYRKALGEAGVDICQIRYMDIQNIIS